MEDGEPAVKRSRSEEETDRLNPSPSLVVHVRNLNSTTNEADLMDALCFFGEIAYVRCIPAKGMALVEFEEEAGARACVSYTQTTQIYVMGQPARFNYSTSKKIQRVGLESEHPSRVLVLSISNVHYPIDVNVIHQICVPYGVVNRIAILRHMQALVEFDTEESAKKAKRAINGADIYYGCCTLKVEFAKVVFIMIMLNTSPIFTSSERFDELRPGKVKVSTNNHLQWDYTISPASGLFFFAFVHFPFYFDSSYFMSFGCEGDTNADMSHQGIPCGKNMAYGGWYGAIGNYGAAGNVGGLYGTYAARAEVPGNGAGYAQEFGGYDANTGTCDFNVNASISAEGNSSGENGATNKDFVDYDAAGGVDLKMPQRGNGSILMVYGADESVFNCDKLYNLLCLYGNCYRAKFMKSKPGTCMVEMGSANEVNVAIENLSGATLNYASSRNHRFTSPERAARNRIVKPCPILHWFNASPTMDEECLKKVHPPKSEQRTTSGFCEFESTERALEALALANNTAVELPGGKALYTVKFSFAGSQGGRPSRLS
ncbi:unnamed protein product [Toxocara canis]|uniref:Heterogeneous nuclear ribonucleoprotein L n=1 Tax=Toxocara canis TaxID=6265 RepID=A0A183UXL6_TOXCA|nr:unnamed protein product [Toxocara canis]